MRRLCSVSLLGIVLLGAAGAPPPAEAADPPDIAVGVWVMRVRPDADMAGARVVVTASRARPARQVLEGDGEGMAFTELRFAGGATSAQLVITPVVPAGMHIESGGCDRLGFNQAAEGGAPFTTVPRDGRVVITLARRQSTSCIFTLAPGAPPDTATATVPTTVAGRTGQAMPTGLLLALVAVGGLAAGIQRVRSGGRTRAG